MAHATFMENFGYQTLNQIGMHIEALKIKYSRLGMDRRIYSSEAAFQNEMRTKLHAFILEHQDIIRSIKRICYCNLHSSCMILLIV